MHQLVRADDGVYRTDIETRQPIRPSSMTARGVNVAQVQRRRWCVQQLASAAIVISPPGGRWLMPASPCATTSAYARQRG
jgi:hypothetical protein